MTTKTIKTILFASLFVAMILPFAGMQSAFAAHDGDVPNATHGTGVPNGQYGPLVPVVPDNTHGPEVPVVPVVPVNSNW